MEDDIGLPFGQLLLGVGFCARGLRLFGQYLCQVGARYGGSRSVPSAVRATSWQIFIYHMVNCWFNISMLIIDSGELIQ